MAASSFTALEGGVFFQGSLAQHLPIGAEVQTSTLTQLVFNRTALRGGRRGRRAAQEGDTNIDGRSSPSGTYSVVQKNFPPV